MTAASDSTAFMYLYLSFQPLDGFWRFFLVRAKRVKLVCEMCRHKQCASHETRTSDCVLVLYLMLSSDQSFFVQFLDIYAN